MLNCLFFRIFSSVRMKWVWASARYLAFGRAPEHRRLAKCDAGSSRTGGFSPPRRGILCAGLPYCTCIFHVVRTLAQRWLFPLRRTHTRCRGRKPHTAATRASRRRTVPLWKGARMQTVQGVTPLPSCSGKRQSHWSARRSERMLRFRFAIFSVRSEMPSCFASAKTSSAGLVCVRNLRSSSSICMVFVCTCPVPFRMLSTVASQKPFHRKPCSG